MFSVEYDKRCSSCFWSQVFQVLQPKRTMIDLYCFSGCLWKLWACRWTLDMLNLAQELLPKLIVSSLLNSQWVTDKVSWLFVCLFVFVSFFFTIKGIRALCSLQGRADKPLGAGSSCWSNWAAALLVMSPAVITHAGPGACLHHSRELEELREGEGPSKAEKEREVKRRKMKT